MPLGSCRRTATAQRPPLTLSNLTHWGSRSSSLHGPAAPGSLPHSGKGLPRNQTPGERHRKQGRQPGSCRAWILRWRCCARCLSHVTGLEGVGHRCSSRGFHSLQTSPLMHDWLLHDQGALLLGPTQGLQTLLPSSTWDMASLTAPCKHFPCPCRTE